jgi:hypothetical protein
MFKGHIASGTVEGTGSAINVELGFTPTYVKVVNFDDPGMLEWWSGMGAAAGVKLNDTPALTKVTSNGITAYDGTQGATSQGFTIGADADINVGSETLFWIAYGEG